MCIRHATHGALPRGQREALKPGHHLGARADQQTAGLKLRQRSGRPPAMPAAAEGLAETNARRRCSYAFGNLVPPKIAGLHHVGASHLMSLGRGGKSRSNGACQELQHAGHPRTRTWRLMHPPCTPAPLQRRTHVRCCCSLPGTPPPVRAGSTARQCQVCAAAIRGVAVSDHAKSYIAPIRKPPCAQKAPGRII